MKQNLRGPGAVAVTVLIAATGLAAEHEVPFKLYRGYTIVVQGRIGGMEKRNFLVDTGAVPSVLDERVARKLRLRGREESLSVFSGKLQAQRVDVPGVQLGPVQAASMSMLVRDLRFIEEKMGVRIDAMIGLDFLNQSGFSIDYERKILSFGLPELSGEMVSFIPGLPYPIVEFHAQGHLVRLLVDTGAKDLILFEPRVRTRLASWRALGTKTSANMNGSVDLRQVELAEVRLGQSELGNLNAYILDVPGASVPGFDGLLGITSLGVKRVWFDFRRSLMGWER
jgi:predicted aspartyl protease